MKALSEATTTGSSGTLLADGLDAAFYAVDVGHLSFAAKSVYVLRFDVI